MAGVYLNKGGIVITAKEFADGFYGRDYGNEITKLEEERAKELGLVVVYGYSDNNVEFRGAIDDEVGVYNGATICLTKTGLFEEPHDICTQDCPFLAAALEKAKTIKAVWHDEGNPCWTFETDIPHEVFNIYEDGDLFCVGIVFSVEDL